MNLLPQGGPVGTQRLMSIDPQRDLAISRRLLDLAMKHPEYGYLRLKQLLQYEFKDAQFSNYSVQRMLKRLKLSTFEERRAFSLTKMRVKVSPQERLMLLRTGMRAKRSVAAACREMGVSRKTYYKWKSRLSDKKQLSLSDLSDKKWSLEAHPHKFTPEQEKLVLSMVRQYPHLSSSKLAAMVGVSNHGVQNVFERNKLNYVTDRLLYSGGLSDAVAPQLTQTRFADLPPSQFELGPQQMPAPPPQVSLDTKLPVYSDAPTFLQQPQNVTPLQPVSEIIPPVEGAAAQNVLHVQQVQPQDERVSFAQPVSVIGPDVAGFRFANIPLSFSISVLVGGVVAFLLANLYDGAALAISLSQLIGVFLAFVALSSGFLFFLYSLKYYYSVIKLLMFSRKSEALNLDQSAKKSIQPGLIANLENVTLSRHPFVSIHLPLYNEKRVVHRLLEAVTSLTYDSYEVIVCDDSTDETTALVMEWQNHPRIKISHRESRDGYKGAALKQALTLMDERTEFVVVFDADFLPYPDTIEQFLKYFKISGYEFDGNVVKQSSTAAVQGYQWHVLNKSENWITRGVRTEYAGSYVIERSGTEVYGGLKQIAGSVFMIRADLLKDARYTWGRSITEDFELTLKLYRDGYKVVYTPYIQAPSECVSTLKRLIRQRMRWAEGHSFNIKKHFWELISSKHTRLSEKLDVGYLSPYYLQSFFFVLGTVCWFTSEVVFRVKLPFWTAVWGWSLVLTNLVSLPLMNTVGLFLEEAEGKDYAGIPSFLLLSYILAPFQAYAAVKGFVESEEGPWFRTPKTGRITDKIARGTFYRWFEKLFHHESPQPAVAVGPMVVPRLSFNLNFAGNAIRPHSLSRRAKFVSRTMLVLLLIVTISLSSLPRAVPSVQATNPSDTTWYIRDYQDMGDNTHGYQTLIFCLTTDNCKVAVVDETDQGLGFVDCDNTTCTQNTKTTIDSSNASNGVSMYCPTSDDCKMIHRGGSSNLEFVDCANETCSSSTTTTIDGSGCALTGCDTGMTPGNMTSIYCPSATDCKVAYRDGTNTALKFIDCDNATCSSGTVTILDGNTGCALTNCVTGDNAGNYSSIYCVSATDCKISYYNETGTALRFADCDSATCASGTMTKLDGEASCVLTNCATGGSVGLSTSIDCPATDDCKIAYYDLTNTDLRVADCSAASCSSGTTTKADGGASCTLTSCATASDVGFSPAIDCISATSCKITYLDNSGVYLRFADCTQSSVMCDGGSVSIPDGETGCTLTNCDTLSTGAFNSISCVSASDCKLIYYREQGGDLMFADCDDSTCSSGTRITLDGNAFINAVQGATVVTRSFNGVSPDSTIQWVSFDKYPNGGLDGALNSGTYTLNLYFDNNNIVGTMSWNYEFGYCTVASDCNTRTVHATSATQNFTGATTSPQSIGATAASSATLPLPTYANYLYLRLTVTSAPTSGGIRIRMNHNAANTANTYIDIPTLSVPEFIVIALPVAIFTPFVIRYLRRRRAERVIARKL